MTDPGPDWRRLPSLSALRAFEAAARLGGFSAAGRALNVTHAAIGQAVRALEADLGVALLRRDGRGLRLTDEGERLARALREGFATIAQGVEALRAGARGALRVTTTPAFAESVLMPRLGDFWRRHPEIAVSVTPDAELRDLAREGFDLAVRSGPGGWPGVAAERLAAGQLIVVAAPALLADGGTDLARLPWLLVPGDGEEAAWLRGAGLDPDALAVRPVERSGLAVAAARAGYGLLFATDLVVRDDLAAGRLRTLPFPGLPAWDYWIVTPPGPRRPAVAAFAAWLRAQFASSDCFT
jgi:LysR family glycine cleavage system transcriptional activator